MYNKIIDDIQCYIHIFTKLPRIEFSYSPDLKNITILNVDDSLILTISDRTNQYKQLYSTRYSSTQLGWF